jgi:hypothetical protein
VRIPIKAVREFGRKWGLAHVIIFAHQADSRIHHILTWGRSTEESGQAVDFANTLKKQLGWPEALYPQPSRVRRLMQRIRDLDAELIEARAPKAEK